MTNGTEERHPLYPREEKCTDRETNTRRLGTVGFGNDVDSPWIQSLPTSLWKKSQATRNDGGRRSNDCGLWGDAGFL